MNQMQHLYEQMQQLGYQLMLIAKMEVFVCALGIRNWLLSKEGRKKKKNPEGSLVLSSYYLRLGGGVPSTRH